MRAMVLPAPGVPLQLEERADPQPGEEEIRVKVSACGVCRTDLHVVDAELPNINYPIIPGHEIVGRVDLIGSNATTLRIGDRVGIPWLGHTCGNCRFCKEDLENLCDNPLFTGYTRDGSFQVNAQGQLVTNNGYAVQPGITIPSTAQSVTIGSDGTVSVTVPGQSAPQTVGQLQIASFVNPAGLEPKGQNMFGETAASGTANGGTPGQGGLGTLRQGFVETSNVNVVEELVSMIQTQRAYELNSKAIQTSDQMLQRLSQL